MRRLPSSRLSSLELSFVGFEACSAVVGVETAGARLVAVHLASSPVLSWLILLYRIFTSISPVPEITLMPFSFHSNGELTLVGNEITCVSSFFKFVDDRLPRLLGPATACHTPAYSRIQQSWMAVKI